MKSMKKVPHWSNPLHNIERFDLIEKYENCQTDEEIANFYHSSLSKSNFNPVLNRMIWAMIDYSTGISSNSINILL